MGAGPITRLCSRHPAQTRDGRTRTRGGGESGAPTPRTTVTTGATSRRGRPNERGLSGRGGRDQGGAYDPGHPHHPGTHDPGRATTLEDRRLESELDVPEEGGGVRPPGPLHHRPSRPAPSADPPDPRRAGNGQAAGQPVLFRRTSRSAALVTGTAPGSWIPPGKLRPRGDRNITVDQARLLPRFRTSASPAPVAWTEGGAAAPVTPVRGGKIPPGGDPLQLRGIPVVGPGVGGVAPGTHPERTAIRNLDRDRRSREW